MKAVLHLCFKVTPTDRVGRMSWDNLPNALPSASLGRRVLALIIDWIMSLAIAGLLTPIIFPNNSFSTLIVFFVELCLFTTLIQASAGQRIMAIKVVTYPDQRRVTPGKIVLRSFLICLVFPAVLTNNGRPLHDHFTKSQTVRELY